MTISTKSYPQPLSAFTDLYAPSAQTEQLARYRHLAAWLDEFAPGDVASVFLSAPGRTELAGNHTDHNHGHVLAASIDKDLVAAVRPRNDNRVVLRSSGFDREFAVDLADLTPVPSEQNTTESLLRGVAAEFVSRGYRAGGFSAVVDSQVPVGSGLSSSAAFEVLIGGAQNVLYNDSSVSTVALAQIGQAAENRFFGKPCGLMDQLAVAVGGILHIDFTEPPAPGIERLGAGLLRDDFTLLVVETGDSHADLTPDYASIPIEMKHAAALLGGEMLGTLDPAMIRARLGEIRRELGDRTVLRVLHFLTENERVPAMVAALRDGDTARFHQLADQCGRSSFACLQNAIPSRNGGEEQPMALALGASQVFFEGMGRGVGRVHGGGFAGTMQAWVHRDDLAAYTAWMEALLGEGCVKPLVLRPVGVTTVEGVE